MKDPCSSTLYLALRILNKMRKRNEILEDLIEILETLTDLMTMTKDPQVEDHLEEEDAHLEEDPQEEDRQEEEAVDRMVRLPIQMILTQIIQLEVNGYLTDLREQSDLKLRIKETSKQDFDSIKESNSRRSQLGMVMGILC